MKSLMSRWCFAWLARSIATEATMGVSSWSRGPYTRPPPADTLPLDDPRLMPKQPESGEAWEADQVHLIGGPPGKVGILWAGLRKFARSGTGVEHCLANHSRQLACERDRIIFVKAVGPRTYTTLNDAKEAPGCGPDAYTRAECYYSSPPLFSVRLEDLAPDAMYLYRIRNESKWRRFKTPPAVGAPITFGVVADLGQTNNSKQTVQMMQAQLPYDAKYGSMDAILFPGDLAYADGFGPRWDSYARLVEPLFSQVPTAYTIGNHEIANGMENTHAFEKRYPALFLSDDSLSSSDLYYSFDAGLAHVIMLCSYCDFAPGSMQYQWLQYDLSQISRSRTPWVVLAWHTPWYTSNAHHPMAEGAAMREAMESLIHDAGADIVFNGHMHGYERTLPIFQNKTSLCNGTIYITIGDGGNRECFATPWATPATPAPPLYGQPTWSAIREFEYGHGLLHISNATHAEWVWFRNDRGDGVESDHVWLSKPSYGACADSSPTNQLVV